MFQVVLLDLEDDLDLVGVVIITTITIIITTITIITTGKMECLVKNIWIPLSRTDIIQETWWWDSLFDDDGKLDVYIFVIRSKLGKDIIES